MIVKVQISLYSSTGSTDMLIYNQDRSVMYQDEATPAIKHVMGKELKKYFKASLVDDGNGGKRIQIDKEVAARNW